MAQRKKGRKRHGEIGIGDWCWFFPEKGMDSPELKSGSKVQVIDISKPIARVKKSQRAHKIYIVMLDQLKLSNAG